MPSTLAAMRPRAMPSGRTFDPDVLGGHYTGHHANELKPKDQHGQGSREPSDHGGCSDALFGQGSLYKTRPLAASAHALLLGEIAGQPVEPVAWVNLMGSSRVFYTSLGHPGDFDNTAFRRLLRNAVFWALNRQTAGPADLDCGFQVEVDRRCTPGSSAGSRSQALADELSQGPLSPEQALAAFRVADDLQIDLVLAEPIVRQPVSLSFDERGRLWVVQYLQYPFPAGLKMVSHDSVWCAVYDKVPQAPPHHVRGRDKITIHEDTDGDGVFDRHKTFVEGLNIATSGACADAGASGY